MYVHGTLLANHEHTNRLRRQMTATANNECALVKSDDGTSLSHAEPCNNQVQLQEVLFHKVLPSSRIESFKCETKRHVLLKEERGIYVQRSDISAHLCNPRAD